MPENKTSTLFAAKLNEQMKAHRFRGVELSENMGVTSSYVSSLRVGNKLANAQTADKVADALGVSDLERVELHRAAAVDAGFRLELPDDF